MILGSAGMVFAGDDWCEGGLPVPAADLEGEKDLAERIKKAVNDNVVGPVAETLVRDVLAALIPDTEPAKT